MLGVLKQVYENSIFPRLMEMSLASRRVSEQRRDLLSAIEGKVLEIGFGTGLNVEFYPDYIHAITAIDPNDSMNTHFKRKPGQLDLVVDLYDMSAEKMGFDSDSFDSVVSTFTFCTIPDPAKALREVFRVLKPGGRFYYLEHGLSPNHLVAALQNLTNPLFKVLACGCNVNRDIRGIVAASEFVLERMETFYLEPKISGYTYKGIALKPNRLGEYT